MEHGTVNGEVERDPAFARCLDELEAGLEISLQEYAKDLAAELSISFAPAEEAEDYNFGEYRDRHFALAMEELEAALNETQFFELAEKRKKK
jgi:hypothetical protein